MPEGGLERPSGPHVRSRRINRGEKKEHGIVVAENKETCSLTRLLPSPACV